MTALYLLLLAMGVVLLAMDPATLENAPAEATIMGVVFVLLGLALGAGFGFGLALPKRPWGWIYGLVLIAIGMTSMCTLPATIPLLIYWLKPETKLFFGREE